MKTNIYQKLALTSTIVTLGLTAIEVKPSLSVNIKWNLTFYNTTNQQVGSGQFGYEQGISTFVETNPFPSSGFPVKNALTSFSANILGEPWSLNNAPGITWWSSSSRSPGQQRYSSSPQPTIVDNSWFFGDLFLGTRQLLLASIEEVSSNVWQGSWNQSIVASNSFENGTWTAEAVPEPLTILGSAMALGFGVSFKKTLAKKKCKE